MNTVFKTMTDDNTYIIDMLALQMSDALEAFIEDYHDQQVEELRKAVNKYLSQKNIHHE